MNGMLIGSILYSLRRKSVERWCHILSSNVDFQWVDAGEQGLCMITINIAKDRSEEHKQLLKQIEDFHSIFLEHWIECPAILTYSPTPQPFTTELRELDSFKKPNRTKSLILTNAFANRWVDIMRKCRRIEFIEQLDANEPHA
jgi:hypothetical protein